MKLKEQHVKDFTEIMGIEEEMISLISSLGKSGRAMNPWVDELPALLDRLNLQQDYKILDMPCGEGAVSVPLARKYNIKVSGYDIFPDFVDNACALAEREGVSDRCVFQTNDIRDVVKKQNICDVLLWLAGPRIWDKSSEIISQLRNCVVPGGKILIGEAYLYLGADRGLYPDYEEYDETHAGMRFCGDQIISHLDYEGSLWDRDYERNRQWVVSTMDKLADEHQQELARRYLDSLQMDERKDKENLGLAVWILEVRK